SSPSMDALSTMDARLCCLFDVAEEDKANRSSLLKKTSPNVACPSRWLQTTDPSKGNTCRM
ncbi:hypothetical protein ACLOJK_022669, partial [Asimina triloba]